MGGPCGSGPDGSLWECVGWLKVPDGGWLREHLEETNVTCSAMVPDRTLSALLSWFAAMNSGMKMEGRGFRLLMWGRSSSCSDQSRTWARSIARPKSIDEMSQPDQHTHTHTHTRKQINKGNAVLVVLNTDLFESQCGVLGLMTVA